MSSNNRFASLCMDEDDGVGNVAAPVETVVPAQKYVPKQQQMAPPSHYGNSVFQNRKQEHSEGRGYVQNGAFMKKSSAPSYDNPAFQTRRKQEENHYANAAFGGGLKRQGAYDNPAFQNSKKEYSDHQSSVFGGKRQRGEYKESINHYMPGAATEEIKPLKPIRIDSEEDFPSLMGSPVAKGGSVASTPKSTISFASAAQKALEKENKKKEEEELRAILRKQRDIERQYNNPIISLGITSRQPSYVMSIYEDDHEYEDERLDNDIDYNSDGEGPVMMDAEDDDSE